MELARTHHRLEKNNFNFCHSTSHDQEDPNNALTRQNSLFQCKLVKYLGLSEIYDYLSLKYSTVIVTQAWYFNHYCNIVHCPPGMKASPTHRI